MSTGAWAGLSAILLTLGAVAVAVDAGLRRRRQRVREALHELRRPLQAVVLAGDPGRDHPLVAQLRTAMADLEDAIAGRAEAARRRDSVTPAELLEDASRRWRSRRAAVHVEPPPGEALLEADRVRLGMALDNLIANGLEHGRGPVEVAASLSERTLRLEVSNGRRRGSLPPDGTIAPPKGVSDPRRGHGLRIADRQAASDDGTLMPPASRPDGSVVAAVELPRADVPGEP